MKGLPKVIENVILDWELEQGKISVYKRHCLDNEQHSNMS